MLLHIKALYSVEFISVVTANLFNNQVNLAGLNIH